MSPIRTWRTIRCAACAGAEQPCSTRRSTRARTLPAEQFRDHDDRYGKSGDNVIPAKTTLAFNVRFNDTWTPETLRAEISRRVAAAAENALYRNGKDEAVRYDIEWKDRPSPVFLTRDATLTDTIRRAVIEVTGREPELSTSGGTSDARFIKDYCPVVEFGLVGQTMHMVDERVALNDLETLTEIYGRLIKDWFKSAA
jgi:succinyl-diaminopimelate desuccinylase